MRYEREHKANTRKKILGDAARRFRLEGLGGASVATVMRDTGLTHGGFYKHFPSKTDLLVESVGEAFREIAAWLVGVAEEAPAGSAWKAIVAAYLSLAHCDHPGKGCPLAALAPELGRSEKNVKARIAAGMVNYKDRLVRFMPGRRRDDRERAFFAIFSTMIGAVALARMMPDTAMRKRVLDTAKGFLLDCYGKRSHRSAQLKQSGRPRSIPAMSPQRQDHLPVWRKGVSPAGAPKRQA
jgi:TetR/AcrR family transcriptional regulator, transcriptional repressor for nem operon